MSNVKSSYNREVKKDENYANVLQQQKKEKRQGYGNLSINKYIVSRYLFQHPSLCNPCFQFRSFFTQSRK